MKRKKLLILGAGGHAKSCIDVIEQHRKYEIIGLVGTVDQVGSEISGYEVLGTDDDLERLSKYVSNAVIGVGGIKNQELRINLIRRATTFGFDLPTIISPRALISKRSEIRSGTFIFHDVVVNTEAKLAEHCIINSKSLIEHDVQIGKFCHISTNVTINGQVSVGDASFLGSGSVIKEGIKIGSNCIIGMGTVLRSDLEDSTKYVG